MAEEKYIASNSVPKNPKLLENVRTPNLRLSSHRSISLSSPIQLMIPTRLWEVPLRVASKSRPLEKMPQGRKILEILVMHVVQSRGGNQAGWAGPTMGRAKIGLFF